MAEDVLNIPWEKMTGMLAFFILLAGTAGKWIPFLNKLIEAWLDWIGSAFTRSMREQVTELSNKVETHIQDPDAHQNLFRDLVNGVLKLVAVKEKEVDAIKQQSSAMVDKVSELVERESAGDGTPGSG